VLASPVVNVAGQRPPGAAADQHRVAGSLIVALFAVLLAPRHISRRRLPDGYGFGSSILVSSMCLLPSGVVSCSIFSLLFAEDLRRYGPKVTSPWGGHRRPRFVERIAASAYLWEVLSGPRWPA